MAKKVSSANPGATAKQRFRYHAPAAMMVLLAADFTDWQAKPIPMKKGADGVWEVEVNLAPGTYHYRFMVDGEWRDDPECTLRVPNPFGSANAVRHVA